MPASLASRPSLRIPLYPSLNCLRSEGKRSLAISSRLVLDGRLASLGFHALIGLNMLGLPLLSRPAQYDQLPLESLWICRVLRFLLLSSAITSMRLPSLLLLIIFLTSMIILVKLVAGIGFEPMISRI